MHIGIVSDTHDNLRLARAAAEFFEDRADIVVHCGDVVAPFTAMVFDSEYEFYAVRGNNEGERALEQVIETFGTHLGEAGPVSVADRELAVYHGTDETLLSALVDCGEYDYVLHGHTHLHGTETRGATTRINPGGLPIPGADDAFHVALLNTDTDEIEHHELS